MRKYLFALVTLAALVGAGMTAGLIHTPAYACDEASGAGGHTP